MDIQVCEACNNKLPVEVMRMDEYGGWFCIECIKEMDSDTYPCNDCGDKVDVEDYVKNNGICIDCHNFNKSR